VYFTVIVDIMPLHSNERNSLQLNSLQLVTAVCGSLHFFPILVGNEHPFQNEADMAAYYVRLLDEGMHKKASQKHMLYHVTEMTKTLPPELAAEAPRRWYQLERFIALHTEATPSFVHYYHVCPNDCILFRREHAHLTVCPNANCGGQRYFPGTLKPRRVYPYCPMIPRVKQRYKSAAWSKRYEYASSRAAPDNGVFKDVYDGAAYKRVFGEGRILGTGEFKLPNSKYNSGYMLGADSIIARECDQYAITPLLMMTVTYDPKFRAGWYFIMKIGDVPGPGLNNLVTFLGPLIEELHIGWTGFQVYDALIREWKTARIVLLFIITDLRGKAKLDCGNQHPSKLACNFDKSVGVWLPAYKTTVYPAAWLYLPHTNVHRQQAVRMRLPGSPEGDAPAPAMRTHAELLAAGLAADACGLKITSKHHPCRTQWAQCSSPFAALPYVDLRTLVVVDNKHQVMNEGKMFGKCCLAIKAAALTPARLELERDRGRIIPDPLNPPWKMAPSEVDAFNNLLCTIQIPSAKGGRIRPILIKKNLGYAKMKDWQLLVGHLGIYLLQKTNSFEAKPEYRS
jgi:hypothetical protein